jgi:class 3 adenylate cyclase
MTPLQTTVLMKTDIAGSTPRFRALLPADLQALVLEHRGFIAQHAAVQGGEIVRLEGDGYWLKFPSVTGAAISAITMQETLRLTQTNRGDDRLSMRIVIGLGDIAFQENDLIGDVLALVVRIEAITPADEIYVTSAARLALTSSEVQTALVDNFVLRGFIEPMPVYRVEQRQRTRIIDEAYILVSDLRGFTRLTEPQPVAAIERLLDTLDAMVHRIAHGFDGTIRFHFGDSYCLTFSNVAQLIAAAR